MTTAYILQPAPDLEIAVMRLLTENFPELAQPDGGRRRVETETPDDLSTIVTSSAMFARVSDISGPATDRHGACAQIDVDLFGRSRTATRDLAFAIQALLEGYPHTVFVGESFVLVDEVVTSRTPSRVPWDDVVLRRYYASYLLSARR